MQVDEKYPCVACGRLVFDEPPGSYMICPVCQWEDDAAQLRWPDYPVGPNYMSLREYQAKVLRLGKSGEPAGEAVVDGGWELEPGFRPIDPSDGFEDPGEVGAPWPFGGPRMVEAPWPDDLTRLYWWRSTFWRS